MLGVLSLLHNLIGYLLSNRKYCKYFLFMLFNLIIPNYFWFNVLLDKNKVVYFSLFGTNKYT